MNLPPYVVAEKEVGQTPLEMVTKLKEEHAMPEDTRLSYAGRLDPMASGKLLVLVGDTCKRQRYFTKLDKEYIVEVLLGVGSDTGDALGLVREGKKVSPTDEEIRDALKKEVGVHIVPYPAFSSKTVSGKPLFLHALEGTLGNIAIPTHQEAFYAIRLIEENTYTVRELKERVYSHLAKTPKTTEPSKQLGADFRITDITKAWDELFRTTTQESFTVLRIRVISGSGAYMRSLAGRLGENLGSNGLALSIHRTIIGRYYAPLRLWIKRFS
jgi:tRNA pseudouridine(55) synthase